MLARPGRRLFLPRPLRAIAGCQNRAQFHQTPYVRLGSRTRRLQRLNPCLKPKPTSSYKPTAYHTEPSSPRPIHSIQRPILGPKWLNSPSQSLCNTPHCPAKWHDKHADVHIDACKVLFREQHLPETKPPTQFVVVLMLCETLCHAAPPSVGRAVQERKTLMFETKEAAPTSALEQADIHLTGKAAERVDQTAPTPKHAVLRSAVPRHCVMTKVIAKIRPSINMMFTTWPQSWNHVTSNSLSHLVRLFGRSDVKRIERAGRTSPLFNLFSFTWRGLTILQTFQTGTSSEQLSSHRPPASKSIQAAVS